MFRYTVETVAFGDDQEIQDNYRATIFIRYCCITCMEEYKDKSLEELHWEDYRIHRKRQTHGGFGPGTQSSPFGQSPFGKPITAPSFGGTAATVFGNANNSLSGSKPAGSTSGGLFGNTTATPAFGQPVTSQSSFGGFNTPNTTTGLFGNQQNANTSLFGATNATPAFEQATKPGRFGFGTPTRAGLFGQTQQTTQQTTPSLFGPPNTTTNTNLFGTTSGFSGNNAASGMTGTVVKFSPLTGSDTMMKNDVTQTISTRHYCITCMKEYKGKSLEELRLEDYTAGRKGQTQGAQTTGMFGSPAQPSLFGNTGVNTSTANTGFGTVTTGFGASTQPATTSGLFGKTMAGFGATATTSSAFPFNSTRTTTNPFGANTQTKPFGAAASTPIFGTTNTTQTATAGFGTNNTAPFGTFVGVQPNQSIGLFNQNRAPFNMPASTASTGFTVFRRNTATNTTGGLFAKPAGSTTFGTTPSFAATPAPGFGSVADFGTTPATGSLSHSSSELAKQFLFKSRTAPSTSPVPSIGGCEKSGSGVPLLSFGKPSLPVKGDPNSPETLQPSDEAAKHVFSSVGNDTATAATSIQVTAALTVKESENGTMHEQNQTFVVQSKIKQEANAICNTPRCAGYYIIPPLNTFDEYICGHTCIIPDFTVGHKGHGNIYFPDSVDIFGLDLDEIVHFRNEKIIIHPDDDFRSSMGQPLNRKAQALTEDMMATHTPGYIFVRPVKQSQWALR